MIAALSVLHVIVCLFLIAVVLLQRGKGAEMGAVFGGGASATVFGSRGAGNFLTLLTKICAALFMLTSLSLSYLYSERAGERLFEGDVEAAETAPFEPVGEAAPAPDLGFEEVGTRASDTAGEAAPQAAEAEAPGEAASEPNDPTARDGDGPS
ncbi:MAG TPA: preprotein translocase subunit SecG [Myxococcota bacterium]|nr:preprotein translocase subunit SecG [Myxococcota bacterium]